MPWVSRALFDICASSAMLGGVSTEPMETPDRGERRGPNNQRLCHARRTNGEPCTRFAIKGGKVCAFHGGSAPQVKRKARLRLAELVDPAIATLAREMAGADKSRDRQAAANSILDRSGYGRATKIEADDARELLLQRLLEARELAYQAQGEVAPPATLKSLEKRK